MKTASIESLKIYGAVETFKKTYFDCNACCIFNIATSSATKKDKNDKGYYTVSFSLGAGEKVPDFLEKENYTEEVKQFFEKELNKNIRYLEVSWSYESSGDTFEISIELRF